MKYTWSCPICGRRIENLSLFIWAHLVDTTLYGRFKAKDPRRTKDIVFLNKKQTKVCSEKCKEKNESRYFIEEYKGRKIYCVDGKYMPYFGCPYYFTSIEDCKERIDSQNISIIPISWRD